MDETPVRRDIEVISSVAFPNEKGVQPGRSENPALTSLSWTLELRIIKLQ
jgi:hypothetical protein